jgi:hypothetical protein
MLTTKMASRQVQQAAKTLFTSKPTFQNMPNTIPQILSNTKNSRKRWALSTGPFVVLIQFFHNLSQTPLPEQEGPTTGTVGTFELMSSKDLAYQMTTYDWELFNCVHEVRRPARSVHGLHRILSEACWPDATHVSVCYHMETT